MSTRRRSSGSRVAWSFGAAFTSHGGLYLLLVVIGVGKNCGGGFADGVRVESWGRSAGPSGEMLDVSLIEAAPLRPLASSSVFEAEELAEILEKHKEAIEQEDDPNKEGQVVEAAAPAVEIVPNESRFLSEYNIKVEKETQGPKASAVGGPSSPAITPQVPQAAQARSESTPASEQEPAAGDGNGQPAGDGGRGLLAMRSPKPVAEVEPKITQQKGGDLSGVEPEAGGVLPAKGERPGVPFGGNSSVPVQVKAPSPGGRGAEGKKGVPDLRPSPELLARAVGQGSLDYLKDIDEGAHTLLNTMRWKHAAFFNRVKRQVAKNWRPAAAYNLRDPSGNIYGIKTRVTLVKVSLNRRGEVKNIVVTDSSDVDFLDDEAVNAFRNTNRFPHPPESLIDKDSRLITFSFGFYFVTNRDTKFRVFKY